MKHGLANHRIYKIWNNMKSRCYYINHDHYKEYGDRGVSICQEWLDDFISFYNWSIENGYKDNLSIDRIDNDGNYEPKNCRWVTMSEQAINRGKMRNNTSGYVGIKWSKKTNKWESNVSVNCERKYLGQFDSKEEALGARNEYIMKNKLTHKIQEYTQQRGGLWSTSLIS